MMAMILAIVAVLLSISNCSPRQEYTNLENALTNPDSVKHLDLSGQKLGRIPADITRLSNLQTLVLKDNQITEIPDKLNRLKKLKNLDLSHNQIVEITGLDMPFLTRIDLSHNLIEKLALKSDSLKQVTSLNLKANRLRAIPATIWQLPSLTHLNVSQNSIQTIQVTEKSTVTELDLTQNKLGRLPESIQNLPALEKLYLQQNQIYEITPEIRQLKQLTVLKTGDHTIEEKKQNLLIAFPFEIGELKNLKVLDASHNKIVVLPTSFKELSGLEQLHLQGNALYQFREGIAEGLTSLKELNLKNNNLNQLPSDAGQLIQLQKVNLAQNKLSVFPEDFKGWGQVQSIDLSENKFETAPPILASFKSLNHLVLDKNPLQDIASLKNMKQIKTISLKQVKLSDVQKKWIVQELSSKDITLSE